MSLLRLYNYGHRNIRRILPRAKHLLRCACEVRLLRQKDVRHESLRVAIDHRKPRALHLHHYPVTLEEDMVVGGESNFIASHRIRYDWLRLLKAVAVSAAQH